MSRSNEPLLWLLFSAGGVLAALLSPILLLLFGVPFRWDGSPLPHTSISFRSSVTRSPACFYSPFARFARSRCPSFSLHPLRRAPDKALERVRQRALLWWRDRGIGCGRVSPVERAVAARPGIRRERGPASSLASPAVFRKDETSEATRRFGGLRWLRVSS